MARWFLELKGDEKIHAKLILAGMFIIIVLLLYIIIADKKVEFFVDTQDLYNIIIKNIHCKVCHGGK